MRSVRCLTPPRVRTPLSESVDEARTAPAGPSHTAPTGLSAMRNRRTRGTSPLSSAVRIHVLPRGPFRCGRALRP
jgi:hypothetical protein